MQKLFSSLPWHWLPPLLTLAVVLSSHMDVPYHDQWDLLPLLHAWYQGTLQWQDLLAPHNGHILLLPKTVMLTLAVLTQWNTLAEVLFGFACMLGCWQLLQALAAILAGRSLLLAEQTALSLLVFSLAQAQNWLWGWQLQIPLALLCLLAGITLLLRQRSDSAALALAALCGAAATLSFAGSLPYWIAVLPLVWQRKPWLVLPWLLIAALCLLAYARLAGMSGGGHWPDPAELPRHLRNTLAVLGNLVARYNGLAATAAGVIGLAIVAMPFARLAPAQKALASSLLLFCLGSALLVSLSRAGLGDEQMLASRYGTLMLPFWTVATILLLQGIRQPANKGALLTGTLLLCSVIGSSLYSLQDIQQLHKRQTKGALALAQINTAAGQQQLAVINPRHDRAQALQEVALLQQYRLSFFRHGDRANAP